MKTRNSFSGKEYIYYHTVVCIAALAWYKTLSFHVIPGLRPSESWNTLIVLVVFFGALGIVSTWNRFRNYYSMFGNIVVPFFIYFFAVHRRDSPIIICGMLGVCVLFFLCNVISRKSSRHRRVKTPKVLREKLWRVYIRLAICLFITLICFMSGTWITKMMGVSKTGLASAQYDDHTNEISEILIEAFEEDTWKTLPVSKKIEALQAAADMEARALGIPYKLYVDVKDLPSETRARYINSSHIIEIDKERLEKEMAQDMLGSICHEVYHAHQACLCEAFETMDAEYKSLLFFQTIRTYQREFDQYNNGDDDYTGYYEQKIESDARAYAASEVERLYRLVGK